MTEARGRRRVACLLAGGAILGVSKMGLQTFAAPQPETLGLEIRRPVAVHRLADPRGAFRGAVPESTPSSMLGSSLCGIALAAAACIRGLKLVMNSQGQGGRFNYGQSFMPKLKGAKKMAVLRPRKNYGSHGARKVPRRYELYDKLEEIDERIPWYTVLSEPEEPVESCRDVPIMKRYPWAGPLNPLPKAKQDVEDDPDTALEPYFASMRDAPPPIGRTQNYVHRRGWPRYNHPPWINRPLIGTGVSKYHLNNKPFLKDRRPKRHETWKGSRSRKLWGKDLDARNKKIAEIMGTGKKVESLPMASEEDADDLDAALDDLAGGN